MSPAERGSLAVRWVRYTVGFLSSVLLVLLPSYGVERLANFYFLTSNPFFGELSGARIWLFILLILAGSIAAGVILGGFVAAGVSSITGVACLVSLVYWLCYPKVCYSAGLDGLEPLRLMFFLGSVGLLGVWGGVYLHNRRPVEGAASVLVPAATFCAIGYYPIVFTFAGASLLEAPSPFFVVLLVFLLSLFIAEASTRVLGLVAGPTVTVSSGALTICISLGIAKAYLGMVTWDAILIGLAVLAGAASGGLIATHGGARTRDFFVRHVRSYLLLLVAFLLVMTVVVYPDAAVGITAQSRAAGGISFGMGVPVYSGAYMNAPLGNTKAESLGVSFAGTNLTSIQGNNYLAAGIGAHSPGCCVDGIDYGYRFDAYLFRTGEVILVASAWEVCDYNAACGGHSWKSLMLLSSSSIGTPDLSTKIELTLEWRSHMVCWTYELGSGPNKNLTEFEAPTEENSYFSTGLQRGGLGSYMSGFYFFQFGIMSRYPIGRGGWSVTLSCPATLLDSGWSCIDHARTLDGGQSFWKVLWRWGEDYPNVQAQFAPAKAIVFRYSPNGAGSSQLVW